MPLSREDINSIKRWENYAKQVRNATTIDVRETEAEKQKRIAHLLKPGNELEAFKYYFPNYAKSPFAKFHKKLTRKFCDAEKGIFAAKWSRGLAKSAISMMIVLIEVLKGKEKLIVMGSNNQDTAILLLRPFKINLESNRRIINDFGIQKGATWSDDEFITTSGVAFYAYGKGQTPRGLRNEDKRVGIILIDDLDTKPNCRNPKIVQETKDWITEDVIPTMGSKGCRVLAVTNKHSKNMAFDVIEEIADHVEQVDILTHTGKYDHAEIRRLSIQLEKAKGKERMLIEEAIRYISEGYESSWPEDYSVLDAVWKIDKAASMRSAQGEYFNNPIVDGSVFTLDMLQDKALPKLREYQSIEVYIDPSWKKTSTADTKAVVAVGAYRGEYHIIKAYCGIASTQEMWNWCYDVYKLVKDAGCACNIRMEVVFAQGIILDDLSQIGKQRGLTLPIMADTRKKPDKDQRIESLAGYFERGLVYFNEAEANNHHMKRLKEQFLAFQPGVKSPKDGPDAVEGAFYYIVQNAIGNVDRWVVVNQEVNNRM